ncbi:MAG: CotH kinase family protein [Clostridium sp.]|uniref:CotH kinase family protein n=1 Tax=Clostridium sp. TaxID=1506 RepID=UPI002FC9B103
MKENKKRRWMLIILLLTFLVGLVFSYKYLYLDYKEYKTGTNNVVNQDHIEFKSHLPVVVINTDVETIGRDKVNGSVEVFDNKYGENNIQKEPSITSNITLKVRGRSSFQFPKKQYLIDFVKDNGNSKSYSLMGMPKNSEWVLNGPYADKSLMRNYLAYSLSSKIMDYAPRVKYCEVFLNNDSNKKVTMDDYVGVYIMVESIRVGDNRINISEKMKGVDTTSYVVARNKAREGDTTIDTYTTKRSKGNPLMIEYPSEDTITSGQLKYIEKDFDNIEKRIYSMMYTDPVLGYREYIDIDSFVDYVVINEFFYNVDAGNLSVYFHKESGGKLKAGPVWDFNISLGNYPDAKNHEKLRMIDYPWFERLLTDEYFLDKVKSRYLQLRKSYLNEKYILSYIDKTVDEIGPAKDRNFKVWGEVFNSYVWPNPEDPRTKSYEEEIDSMKKFIIDHGRWMDNYFESEKYKDLAANRRKPK